jgi:hypothetical protein
LIVIFEEKTMEGTSVAKEITEDTSATKEITEGTSAAIEITKSTSAANNPNEKKGINKKRLETQ